MSLSSSKGSRIGDPIKPRLIIALPSLLETSSCEHWLCSFCYSILCDVYRHDESSSNSGSSRSCEQNQNLCSRKSDLGENNICKCVCSRRYCSVVCQNRDNLENSHWLTCHFTCEVTDDQVQSNMKENERKEITLRPKQLVTWARSRSLSRFKKYVISNTQHNPWVALHMLARLTAPVVSSIAIQGSIDNKKSQSQSTKLLLDEINGFLSQYSEPTANELEGIDASESWSLVQTLLRTDKRNLYLDPLIMAGSISITDIGVTIADVLTLHMWRLMLFVCSRNMIAFDIESPYHELAKSLPSTTDSTKVNLNLQHLEKVLGLGVQFQDMYRPQESSYTNVLSSVPRSFYGTKQHSLSYGLYNTDTSTVPIKKMKSEVKMPTDGVLSKELLKERLIMRLSYLASHQKYYIAEQNPFDKFVFSGYILCDGHSVPIHSCIPTSFLDLSVSSQHQQLQHHDTNLNENIHIQVVAEYDLYDCESISIDKYGVSGKDFESRREIMRNRFSDPIFNCQCPRCQLESAPVTEMLGLGLTARQLCLIAAGYSQEGDHVQARNIYIYVISHHSSLIQQHQEVASSDQLLGDVYYALGASFLDYKDTDGEVLWAEAHRVWRQGYAFYPDHLSLSSAVRKLELHHLFRCPINHQKFSDRSLADNFYCVQLAKHVNSNKNHISKSPSIFLSKMPLLTPADCCSIIVDAERAAGEGVGWTTSRHYAVPTTDLPIHALPSVLEIFNALMRDRIGPMLYEQFGSSLTARSSGHSVCDNFEICVHDAFVVKYLSPLPRECNATSASDCVDIDAKVAEGSAVTYQRHLPLHTDQSTHSLTIALNNIQEYDGGGTYFLDLDDSIRPDIGHVLSFQGDLYHAGEPLLSGTRYIIAAFLLLRCTGTSSLNSRCSKQISNNILTSFNSLKKNEDSLDDSYSSSSTFVFDFI